MEQGMRRIVCAVLASSLVFPIVTLTGCGNKPKRDVPVVTEDMPWYEATITEVDPGIDVSKYTYSGMIVTGKAGDYVVFESFGQLPFGLYEVFTPDINDRHLCVYDLDGNYCYDEDVKAIVRSSVSDAEGIDIESITPVGDNIEISATFSSGGEYRFQMFTYDVAAREVIASRDVRSAEELMSDPDAAYTITNYMAQADGYCIWNYEKVLDTGLEFHMEFTAPDGEKKDICFNEELPMEDPVRTDDYLYLGDSVFAVELENYDHSNIFCIVDLVNDTVIEAGTTTEYSWLYDISKIREYKYYDGVGNALVSQEGIRLLNVEDRIEEIYIDFDDCDINRFDANSLDIIDLQDGKVTLAGDILRNETSNMVFDYTAEIVVLQRCDTNPHAGEKILTAASLEKLSYPMAEAIRLFNLNNEEAIIILDPEYSYDAVAKDVLFDADMDDYTYELQVKAAFMNLLSIDLLANEGPDIILGTMEYDQLNNPDMLLDLSAACEVEGVYENVMEAAKTGDKLYQVPVSVQLEGIMVNKDDVEANAVGFTYDTFRQYLSGPCNGSDPCLMSRMDYLCTVLAESGYTFRTEDGGYNLDNEDFAAAASFVESLTLMSDEELAAQLEWQSWMSKDFSDHVIMTTCLELLYQTRNLVDDNLIMGFPSAEASGLLMNVDQSVAVCAATGAPEACQDFVKLLLGEDIQTLFGMNCGVSVNCTAQATASRWCAEKMNDYYNCVKDVHTYQDRIDLDEPLEEADPELVVSIMDGYMRNAAGFRHSDAAVEIIIREEIQPYFAGQKTIEECMAIIQDRVNTFVDERG